jgi:flavin-dependent dehydrogenase
MSEISLYDIIIVGAGPSGISTALHLAKLAPELVAHTLIVEKARHPRHKLCGGGLLPDAEAILEHLSLDVGELPHTDVDWAWFHYDGMGMRLRAEKGGSYAFRTIRRYEFDHWLAEKARQSGFQIMEDSPVKSISMQDHHIIVETALEKFRAKVVIGADGSKSVVRRFVVPREETHTARLLEILTEPGPDKSPHIQANSYFDFLYVPKGIQGYSWDFPALEKGQQMRNRGIYDSNVHPVRADITLQAALADEVAHQGYSMQDYKLEGHPLRWFEARSTFSAPHVLLVGDAAGADALFGEGISIALGYGQLAAEAIVKAFNDQDFRFRDYRKRILRSQLGRSLRRRTWLARIYYRIRSRRFQAFVWRRLGWLVEWVMQTFMIGWAKR